MISAEVHDSQEFEALLDECKTKRTVYADSTYRSEEAEQMLRKKGFVSRVYHRPRRGVPLNELGTLEQSALKGECASRACFGAQVQAMKQTMIGEVGLERIRLKVGMANLAYNMR